MTTPAAAPRTTAAKTATAKRPMTGTTATGAKAPAAESRKSMEGHLLTLGEGEVLSPQGLYEFLESLRALSSYMAFTVHAASSQLQAAARKGARDSADGRLTLKQKVELAATLRRMSRQMDGACAENLLATATAAVKAYALLEDFLEAIESDTVARPHRAARGGFNLS
jgi:hypothetical protein